MNTRSAVGILLALGAAVLLGLFLRWQMAGATTLFAESFARLRHVHTHLGFYGALLPLAWIAAAGDDDALPRLTAPLYALFVVLAHVGFAFWGYGILAIVGSTGVLGTWLFAAWRRRRLVVHGDGWLFGIPLAMPLAAACIPPIAVFLRRAPPLSQSMIQTFLGILVLAVLVPSALHVVGARAPKKPLWFVAALLGAVALGFDALSFLLLPAAAILLVISVRAPLDFVLRALWLAFGGGAVALSLGLLQPFAGTGVAALHFAVLGPVLPTLVWPYAERVPAALRVAWAIAVAAMSAAILTGSAAGAAITGSVVVALLAINLLLILAPAFRSRLPAR